MYTIKAANNSSEAIKMSTDEFEGLQPVFQLSTRARVIIILNLWAEVCLYNGAMEEVKQ